MGNTIKNMNRLEFLERVGGFGRKKPQTQYEVIKEINDKVKKIIIEYKNYILKESEIRRGLAGIASAEMYNTIGIYTPSLELVNSENSDTIRSVQEDLSSVNGVDILLANDNLEYQKLERMMFGRDKWQIFYDIDLMLAFLQFMTPECLEQLKNLYLVDELRTDRDRWLENFYLYKMPESNKYEGVIAIDLDEMAIFQYCGAKKEDFENFLNISYGSSTPQQTIDDMCYKKRLHEILNLAYDGVLSDSNILAIRNAIKFDLPKELEKLCDKQKVSSKKRNEIIEPIKRLWDYNNKNLGREFEK